MELHVGFTGTQRGMNDEQKRLLRSALEFYWYKLDEGERWFHHGLCLGADEQADQIAQEIGWSRWGHPSTITEKQAEIVCERMESPLPPLTRNLEIVRASNVVLATPWEEFEQRRSGTWATVRYAVREETPVTIITPNGQMKDGELAVGKK